MPIGILAVGSAVPTNVIDNATVAAWAGVTPDWVEQRTGITGRCYAPDGTPTSVLAHAAVLDLLDQHPAALENLGAIILATSTPDQPQPATAAVLQGLLDVGPTPAFDLNAVCTGWLYGVVVGAALAAQPTTGPHVLVVAADKYSTILDRTDQRTVSLFGDGAGATLLGPVPDGYGILASRLAGHGEHRDLVHVKAGGTRQPLDQAGIDAGDNLFRMNGRGVRDYVLRELPTTIKDVLDQAGVDAGAVDRWIFHQANLRLVEQLADNLGLDRARLTLTPEYGNTGAASMPVTLRESHRRAPLTRDELVFIGGVGGGMTNGGLLLRWH